MYPSPQKIKVLIVDDEKDILDILKYSMEDEHFEVFECSDSRLALSLAKKINPDIFLLDVMMPGLNGFELCERIRASELLKDKHILFLTALLDEKSHIKGLRTGADDYLLKPISMNILKAKLENLKDKLRPKQEAGGQALIFGDLTIDVNAHQVSIRGKTYLLARKEFELLYLLASKSHTVFQRERILKNIWGSDVIVSERTIDVHIRKIRRKLGLDCIRTYKGVGYKFEYP